MDLGDALVQLVTRGVSARLDGANADQAAADVHTGEGEVEGAGRDAVLTLRLHEATVDAGALLHPHAHEHWHIAFVVAERVGLHADEELIARRDRWIVRIGYRLRCVEEVGTCGRGEQDCHRDGPDASHVCHPRVSG